MRTLRRQATLRFMELRKSHQKKGSPNVANPQYLGENVYWGGAITMGTRLNKGVPVLQSSCQSGVCRKATHSRTGNLGVEEGAQEEEDDKAEVEEGDDDDDDEDEVRRLEDQVEAPSASKPKKYHSPSCR